MRAVEEPQYNTLFDPFLETATDFGDGGKRMWITEIGWMNFDPNSPTHPDCMNHIVVSEEQQAEYVKQGFDFMLNPNNVSLWNQLGQAAIEKVMWYQFMDIGLKVERGCISSDAIPANPAYLRLHGGQYSGDLLLANQLPKEDEDTEVINWWYGLVDGNMQRRKPAACVFLAYPQTCEAFYSQHIFLPLIRK